MTVGCVGSARTFPVYESKAADTAKEAVSVVESARLTTQVAAEGKAFDPYLSVLLGDAEEQIGAVQGTFRSSHLTVGPTTCAGRSTTC